MVKEGFKYVVLLALVTLICVPLLGRGHWLTYVSAFLTFSIALFFRVAPHPPVVGDRAVLSPAGGWVIEVVDENEPVFMKSQATRISIFMSPLDVHVNTAPVNGVVRYAEYKPGKFFKADRPEARLQNERMSIGIDRADGVKCMATQVAGWLARRIICDVKVGDTVTRGNRYGLIQFGSRMDLHVPAGTRVFVKAGQHVRAAKTVLAEV